MKGRDKNFRATEIRERIFKKTIISVVMDLKAKIMKDEEIEDKKKK